MIYKLCVPETLEGIDRVRLLEWYGEEGHCFEAGEMVVELETHKAVVEVRAAQRGILRQRNVDEGAWCPLGAVVALLADDGEEALPDDDGAVAYLAAEFQIG